MVVGKSICFYLLSDHFYLNLIPSAVVAIYNNIITTLLPNIIYIGFFIFSHAQRANEHSFGFSWLSFQNGQTKQNKTAQHYIQTKNEGITEQTKCIIHVTTWILFTHLSGYKDFLPLKISLAFAFSFIAFTLSGVRLSLYFLHCKNI